MSHNQIFGKFHFMENKNKLWKIIFSPAKTFGEYIVAIFFTIIILALMATVIYFSSTLSTGLSKNIAILFSSLICSLLTIPFTLIWSPKIRVLIKKSDTRDQKIIATQQNEIQNLKLTVENQRANEENLQSKIHLLENLVFNSKSSVDILKVGYKEYTKTSTIRIRKKINETAAKLFSSSGYDEAILIIDCKTKYQRGIDFKNLRLNYQGSNKDAVVVTNLKPEYTSAPSFEYEIFFRELRHVETDKNGNIKKIQIAKDSESLSLLNEIEQESKNNYEASFQSDDNSEAIEETNEIIKISKDCIKLLLKPYFSKIDFDILCEIKDAKPWTEFLQQQIEVYKKVENK